MKIEIDNAKLLDGELFDSETLLTISDVTHVRITKNNRYIAVNTKKYHGFNCIMIDMLKYNISIIE